MMAWELRQFGCEWKVDLRSDGVHGRPLDVLDYVDMVWAGVFDWRPDEMLVLR